MSSLRGFLQLLRAAHDADRVHVGDPATAEQLASVERTLGRALPDDYKELIAELGYLCAGEPPVLVLYGIAPADHGCPCEVDLLRARDEHGVTPLLQINDQLHVLGASEPLRERLTAALQDAIEAGLVAKADAAGGLPREVVEFDEPRRGEATLQMHAVPREVVAALKKEPAVADEIMLYTSVAEFREQTVHWEKTQRDTDPPAAKEMVRRMRSLLEQPRIAKLHDLLGPSVDIVRWPDAIVMCLGVQSLEARVLRGTTPLPCDGTDTIHMLSVAEVKEIAAVIADSEQRLRAGYQPDALRARGLYNNDAASEAMFLAELCGMWEAVVENIQEAAKNGCGWLIRRTDG